MRFLFSLMFTLAAPICLAQQAAPIEKIDGPLVIDDAALYCDEDPGEIPLRRFKQQALQSVEVSAGWLGDLGDDGLSSSHLELAVGTGIPLGSFDNILGVKPRVRIDWIDADAGVDIPSELYQVELQFFYRRPIHDRLSLMAVVSPSVRSDFTTSENAFRMFGLGLLNWQCVPDRLTLSAGAVYLGRADLPVLPAIGLSWTPTSTKTLDLRFPSSRFAYRLAKDGGRSESWLYVTAGLGGNTWAVTRQSSLPDEVSLRDIRLILGVEKLTDGGGGCFAESGYAMGRRLEYESDDSSHDLPDAILIRCGWRY